jgi:hypothetical protein
MKIHNYTIDVQDKRDMRRLHSDVDFDWKKITKQLAQKQEVCRQYRSRRRTPRGQRVPLWTWPTTVVRGEHACPDRQRRANPPNE